MIVPIAALAFLAGLVAAFGGDWLLVRQFERRHGVVPGALPGRIARAEPDHVDHPPETRCCCRDGDRA